MKRWTVGVAIFLAAAGARAGKPQLDDPIGRARAEEVKYGVRTPEEQLAILRAAEAEAAKYARNGPLPYARAPGSVWVNLGPTDADFEVNGATYNKVDSGRVRKIVVDPRDPNVVYVATAGGGVWKTFDALTPVTTNPTTGPRWMPITENVGSLSIGSLAMNPQNPDALLLGLGDPFDVRVPGFLHSEDGGATWSSSIPLSYTAGTALNTATTVRDIAFDPDGLTVLVATNAGLFTNSAGGIGDTTSFSVAALGTSIQAAWSIAYVGSHNWLVTSVDATGASSARRGHLWHGTVSSTTWAWTDVTSALPGVGADPDLSRMSLAAALISGNNYRVYLLAAQAPGLHAGNADQKDVFISSNSGATWASLNMVPGGRAPRNPQGTSASPDHDQFDLDFIHGQAGYNQMILVDPKNPDAVFIGGNLAMGRSLNAGTDWDLLTDWLPFGRNFTGWSPGWGATTYAHADWHAAAIAHIGTT